MLMESLVQLQADAVTGLLSEGQMLAADVKERAKKIAFEWKSKLDSLDIDASNGNCLEAHAFLQLLATFGIFAEFNEDELCKLLPSVSRRRQTPELCRLLGLSQKMPGQCNDELTMHLSLKKNIACHISLNAIVLSENLKCLLNVVFTWKTLRFPICVETTICW
jgi:hypothetical protein